MTAQGDPLDLDGRVFDMVSSTASRVDPDAPTRFRYSEADGVVWGEYTGDTVTDGRFVGTRAGDRLEVSFTHALVAGGAARERHGDVEGRGRPRRAAPRGGVRGRRQPADQRLREVETVL